MEIITSEMEAEKARMLESAYALIGLKMRTKPRGQLANWLRSEKKRLLIRSIS